MAESCDETVYDFVKGDTLSKLRVKFVDAASGEAIPLAGFTPKLAWKDKNGVLIDPLVTMAVVDAPNGVAEHQFLEDELFAGFMRFEPRLYDGTGKLVTSLNLITKRVRELL